MSTGKTLVQEDSPDNVRHGLNLFVAAIKKHAFYPEGNPTLQQAFDLFYEWLGEFLEEFSSLRIDVERSQFLYRGEVVQQEKASERTVIFPLFRDGVQWFEFMNGLPPDELLGFIRLLNRYRELREDSENDLVTALWEAELPHIAHKAVDKFWEAESLVNIASLKAGGKRAVKDASTGTGSSGDPAPEGQPAGGMSLPPLPSSAAGIDEIRAPHGREPGAAPKDRFGYGNKAEDIENPAVRMFLTKLEAAQSSAAALRVRNNAGSDSLSGEQAASEEDFWKLNAEEQAILQDMVAAEEARNTTKDSLDVLLVLMREPLAEPDRILVADFVSEGIRHLLALGDFTCALDFVEQLAAMREDARDGIARFADEVAGAIGCGGVLGALNDAWPHMHTIAEPTLDSLRRMLLLLPPVVVETLAPMAPRCVDPRIQALLMDIVSWQAARSRTDIEPIVRVMPTALILDLIKSYSARGERPPVGLLTKLLRHRESLVREAAARELVADNPENLKAVFHLLRDPDRNIARWLLDHMGGERNPMAERLLLAYLVKKAQANNSRNENFILDCYYALGGCASKASMGHLRRILLQGTWRAFFSLEHTPHRLGAAIALSRMPEEWGAGNILLDGENSRFIGIRRACAQARKELQRRARDNG